MRKFHSSVLPLVLTILGAAFLLGGIAGCAQATSSSTTPAAAPSSTVYAMTQTPGTNWPNLDFAVTPLTGKSFSHVTFTYAVDANMLLSATSFGYNLKYNSLWTPNTGSLTVPAAKDTWTTTSDVATLTWYSSTGNAAYAPVADQAAVFNAWYTGTAASGLYVKQVNVTYTDGVTEVLTFTSSTTTPVHVVASTGTSDATFASRFWVSDWAGSTDLSGSLTQGVKTVAF